MSNLTLENTKKSFELQDKMNSVVNPEWRKAGNPWYRAAWIEAAELLDHFGYKWWKNLNAEADQEQILLELVDIYHFMVSDMIIDNLQPAVVVRSFERTATLKAKDKEDVRTEIESFVSIMIEQKCVPAIDFARTATILGFTLDDILRWYIAKNALNIFRQDNGYKSGEYIKNWNGVEDNVILAAYVKEHDEIVYESVYNFLSTSYENVKKGIVNETV